MFVEARNRLVDWLRRQLVGPPGDDILRMSPLERYPTGVLHPVELGTSGMDPALGDEATETDPMLLADEDDEVLQDGEGEGRTLAQPARRRRYVPPSSVGFSFCVRGAACLTITASATVYERTGERDEKGRFRSQEYERTKLESHSLAWSASDSLTDPFWQGRGGIDVRARPHRDGAILTVTLFNRNRLDAGAPGWQRTQDRVEKALFEVELECIIEAGELVGYPRVDPSLLSEEEQELELQYKDRHIYAIGHGAAVEWLVEPGRTVQIRSDFMPAVETPPMKMVDTGIGKVLELARLADAPPYDELEQFVERYADWVEGQHHLAGDVRDVKERAAAKRICDRMTTALERMRQCVEMLRSDPRADESFRLANRAMFDQMRQARQVDGKEAESGEYRWRPFQLAFLLTVMESAIREDNEFRDVLDLIWFPTGGGKTEAYLGLIAFLIVWRRLKYPDTGGGTVAFMRYTLRLLTRRKRPEKYVIP